MVDMHFAIFHLVVHGLCRDQIRAAIFRAESRLRDPERMKKIGMDISEALHECVLAKGGAATVSTAINGVFDDFANSYAPKSPRFDAAEACAKIFRTVRLTINLETMAEEALRARKPAHPSRWKDPPFGQFRAIATGLAPGCPCVAPRPFPGSPGGCWRSTSFAPGPSPRRNSDHTPCR